MKSPLRWKVPSAVHWLAIAGLFALPTLWRYPLSPATTWVCEKDVTGTCHAEPTLYHRLGFARMPADTSREDPDPEQVVRTDVIDLSDLDEATPSRTNWGTVSIRASNSCWKHHPEGHSWCYGRGFGYVQMPTTLDSFSSVGAAHRQASLIASRFNEFRTSPRQRIFVLPRPRPFAWWNLAVYALAAGLTVHALGRLRTARTRAWLAAVEAIPATPAATPYRG